MDKLKFMKEQMNILAIPYEFMQWSSETIPKNYWVGECSETPTNAEDGYEESTFILTGTTRGTWSELEEVKDKIKKHFPSVGGLRSATDSGSITVFFSGSFPVPTGEADLKRIQINLTIKEWKGLN
jgi:hypothetical protein